MRSRASWLVSDEMVGTELIVRLFLCQPELAKGVEEGGQACGQTTGRSGISCG
jgi:hypothetical protein